MIYSYEVNSINEVRIWVNKEVNPDALIFQPFNPAGTAWQNPEEAQAWAEQMIANMTAANNLVPENPLES